MPGGRNRRVPSGAASWKSVSRGSRSRSRVPLRTNPGAGIRESEGKLMDRDIRKGDRGGLARNRGVGSMDRGVVPGDRVTGVVSVRFGVIARPGLSRNREPGSDDRRWRRVARHGQYSGCDGLVDDRDGSAAPRPGFATRVVTLERGVVVLRSAAARTLARETVSFDRFPVTFAEGGVWLRGSSRSGNVADRSLTVSQTATPRGTRTVKIVPPWSVEATSIVPP